MANPATLKMRVHRARKRAEENLRNVGYGVVPADGITFDLIATRHHDARLIKVTIGPTSTGAIEKIKQVSAPSVFTREIWQNMGGRTFVILYVNKNSPEETAERAPDASPCDGSIMDGYVYFIANEGRGVVKIGESGNVQKRLASMQTGHCDDLKIIGIIPAAFPLRLEGELHAKFHKDHIRGEWFALSDEIKQYIQALEKGE
jgi:hypothetical protein